MISPGLRSAAREPLPGATQDLGRGAERSLCWRSLRTVTRRAIAYVATSDPERALSFYRDVLGLALQEDTPFAIVFDAHGTMLRIQKAPEVVRAPYTCFGLDVDDIVAEVKGLLGKGIEAVRYPQFDQDELGIWSAPGGTRVFWFHDPDGNLLSLSQF